MFFWFRLKSERASSGLQSCFFSSPDEFKGHSLLQAAREADVAKAKKSLVLEIINFKHPHTHETALVRATHARTHTHMRFRWVAQILRRCFRLCVSIARLRRHTQRGNR